jgi:hypothetical protein
MMRHKVSPYSLKFITQASYLCISYYLIILAMPSTAKSSANGRKRACLAPNVTARTTKRSCTGEFSLVSKILAHLSAVATRPLPLVINEDPDHEQLLEANVLHTDNDSYSPQAESQSSHLDKDDGGLKSEDEIEPEDDEIKPKGDEFECGGDTDCDSNNATATVAAVPGRRTLCRQYAMVSIAFSLWKPTHPWPYLD